MYHHRGSPESGRAVPLEVRLHLSKIKQIRHTGLTRYKIYINRHINVYLFIYLYIYMYVYIYVYIYVYMSG